MTNPIGEVRQTFCPVGGSANALSPIGGPSETQQAKTGSNEIASVYTVSQYIHNQTRPVILCANPCRCVHARCVDRGQLSTNLYRLLMFINTVKDSSFYGT